MKKIIIFCLLLSTLISANLHAITKLPAGEFGKKQSVSNPILSPNGKYLASLVRINKENQKGTAIRLLNLETLKSSILSSTDNITFKITSILWANNSTIIVRTKYAAKSGITSVTRRRLLQIDIQTKKVSAVIPDIFWRQRDRRRPSNQANIVDMMMDDPDNILVALQTSTDDLGHAVYKFHLKSNKSKEVQKVRKDTYWYKTDLNHNIRLGTYNPSTKNKIIGKSTKDKNYKKLWEYEDFSEDVVTILGFDKNPDILYYRAYHKGYKAVFKTDISQSPLEPQLVLSDAEDSEDVGGSLIYSNRDKRPVGVRYYSKKGYHYWDDEFIELQKTLNETLPDTKNLIIGMSQDESKILISSFNKIDAGTYYLWDRKSDQLIAVARKFPQFKPENMVKNKKVTYKARDGLDITAYLTQPKKNKDSASPTIIFPHGGPISEETGEFDYWAQFFANRGYNVLQMNFRGSSGYGFDFFKAGIQNWGLQMQTDVEDGTRWLIDEKIADPEKICVVGASYGGYAALMESAKNSDLYQCAVSFAGVTDIPLIIKKSKVFAGGSYYKSVKAQIGSDLKSLAERSPVNLAKEIDIPVLMVHGEDDRQVLIEHGRRMYKKLKRAKKDVKFIEQKDGDHYLTNEEHRIQFFEEMDVFLAKYLN